MTSHKYTHFLTLIRSDRVCDISGYVGVLRAVKGYCVLCATFTSARVVGALATEEAAEKLLHRLGVPRIDFSLIGGKGIRYRKGDLDEALEKITVEQIDARKNKRPRRLASDIFDLPIKEQMAILTAGGIKH